MKFILPAMSGIEALTITYAPPAFENVIKDPDGLGHGKFVALLRGNPPNSGNVIIFQEIGGYPNHWKAAQSLGYRRGDDCIVEAGVFGFDEGTVYISGESPSIKDETGKSTVGPYRESLHQALQNHIYPPKP